MSLQYASVAIALLLAVHAATAVNAQSAAAARQGEDTTGKQIEHARGFTFGSNVAGENIGVCRVLGPFEQTQGQMPLSVVNAT